MLAAVDAGPIQVAFEGFDLLLINRVLDGSYPDDSGIGMIRDLPESAPGAMLISNYPEAIEESVQAGAIPGFGKSEMRSARAEAALRSALGLEESAT